MVADELKVALYANVSENQAAGDPDGAVRLKEGDGGSCLWQLRFKNNELRTRVQDALQTSTSAPS